MALGGLEMANAENCKLQFANRKIAELKIGNQSDVAINPLSSAE
jgi:hypothetical protein